MQRLAIAIPLLLATASLARAANEKPDPEAMKLAKKLTEEGANLVNTRDFKAAADLYAEDGELVMAQDPRGIEDVQVVRGRKAIFDAINDEGGFAKGARLTPTVAYARMVTPDILFLSGIFTLGFGPDNDPGNNPTTFQFSQVRRKVDGKWLISTQRLMLEVDAARKK